MARILLADADAFFVGVARLADPEGAGRAPLLIVGGSRDSRGVVCSASYETRKFGVRSAMPIARALRLCPNAMCVPVPFKGCLAKSVEIRDLLKKFAPVVETASVDEWYMDLSANGAGGGIHIVDAGTEDTFLRSCTLADIPLVGPKFQARLTARGLVSVEDVLRLNEAALRQWLSDREARWLWNRVHGIDGGSVHQRETARGLSRDETFSKDLHDDCHIERELLRLVTRAASDLRGDGLAVRTVAVRIRDWDFRTRSTQRTLPEPVISDRVILRVARELLGSLREARRVPARLVGVRLSGLLKSWKADQLSLFTTPGASGETARDRRLSKAINGVREKFGPKSILPGALSALATLRPERHM